MRVYALFAYIVLRKGPLPLRIGLIITVIMLCLTAPFLVGVRSIALAQPAAIREGRIKAATLYYLTKFVTWPATSFESKEDPLIVCVLGNDTANDFIAETVAGKQVGSRTLKVKFIKASANNIRNQCNVLYLGTLAQTELEEILVITNRSPILTVSGYSDITREGGIVYLFKKENKLRIKINQHTVQAAGLKVSADLLNIAELVGGRP